MINDIVINNIEEFEALNKNKSYMPAFDRIKIHSIYLNDINLNLCEIQTIRKLDTKKITFNNCILGNLNYLQIKTNKTSLIFENMIIDEYFYNNPIFINDINYGFINTNLTNLSFLNKKYIDELSIINNPIKNNLSSLENVRIKKLFLEEITNYSLSDLIYLKNQMTNNYITTIFFGDREEKNTIYLNRVIVNEKILIEE